VARFYRHESCGKCTPCREGTIWTVKMLERIDSGEATPMDIQLIASACENIIGDCLCVLGDAMAMPISSMIARFRGEFEAHIEAARARNGLGAATSGGAATASAAAFAQAATASTGAPLTHGAGA
jgi:NADH-quinone oxidoreductase subunit F